MGQGCGAYRDGFAIQTDRRPVPRQPVMKSRPPTPKSAVTGAWARAAGSPSSGCPAGIANDPTWTSGKQAPGLHPLVALGFGASLRYSCNGTTRQTARACPPTSPVRGRSPKSPRRAPDRCPIVRTARAASAGRPPSPDVSGGGRQETVDGSSGLTGGRPDREGMTEGDEDPGRIHSREGGVASGASPLRRHPA